MPVNTSSFTRGDETPDKGWSQVVEHGIPPFPANFTNLRPLALHMDMARFYGISHCILL